MLVLPDRADPRRRAGLRAHAGAGAACRRGPRSGGRRRARCRQFDSSALAVLLECRREALALGKTFAVAGMPARLRELAALYGVGELLAAAPA